MKFKYQLEKELSKIKDQISYYIKEIYRTIQKEDESINLAAIIALLQTSKTVVAYLEDDKFRYKNKERITNYIEANDDIIKGIVESSRQKNNLN